jgi:tetratricopeptide (TPR) repeat protein
MRGVSFFVLRQIYHALILSAWCKSRLAHGLLGETYIGQNRIRGIDIDDKDACSGIYRSYVAAFKGGAGGGIREELDVSTGRTVARKYFSGGLIGPEQGMITVLRGAGNDESFSGGAEVDVVLTPVPGSDFSELSLDERLERARNALDSGRLSEALAGFEAVLAVDPRNTEALNRLGHLHMMAGDFERAQALFREVVGDPVRNIPAIDPGNTDAFNGLAEIAGISGDHARSGELFRQVLLIDPENSFARQGLWRLRTQVDRYGKKEFGALVQQIISDNDIHGLYKFFYGYHPFGAWLKRPEDGMAAHYDVNGIRGLADLMDIVLRSENPEAQGEFVRDYIENAGIQSYLINVLMALPPSAARDRVGEDFECLFHVAESDARGSLEKAAVYLGGLSEAMEDRLMAKTIAVRNAVAGEERPGTYVPVSGQELAPLRARLAARDRTRDRPDGRDIVLFEDSSSGLVAWGNEVLNYPDGNSLYDVDDDRARQMKQDWKAQAGTMDQVFLGYRAGQIKLPLAMIQLARHGEAVFLFRPVDSVNALLPFGHRNEDVRMIADLVRQRMFPGPVFDPGVWGRGIPGYLQRYWNWRYPSLRKKREEKNALMQIAVQLERLKRSVVNVRGASGVVIRETSDHYYIASAKHIYIGPEQSLNMEVARVSFYGNGFQRPFDAEVVNREDVLSWGGSAGFLNDVLLLRIRKSLIPDDVRAGIAVAPMAELDRTASGEWRPFQPVVMMGVPGALGGKVIEMTFGYTSGIPRESKDDAVRTRNLPAVIRSDTGYSGGPLFMMFDGKCWLLGQRNRGGMEYGGSVYAGLFYIRGQYRCGTPAVAGV